MLLHRSCDSKEKQVTRTHTAGDTHLLAYGEEDTREDPAGEDTVTDDEHVALHIAVCDEAEGVDLSREYDQYQRLMDGPAQTEARASEALAAKLPGVVVLMPDLYERVLRPMGFLLTPSDEGEEQQKGGAGGGRSKAKHGNPVGVAMKGVVLLMADGREEPGSAHGPSKKQKIGDGASGEGGLPHVMKLSRMIVDSKPLIMLPRRFEGNVMPVPPPAAEDADVATKMASGAVMKELKKHFGMVRSMAKQIVKAGGTVAYYTPCVPGEKNAEKNAENNGDTMEEEQAQPAGENDDEGGALLREWLKKGEDGENEEMAEGADDHDEERDQFLPEVALTSPLSPLLAHLSLPSHLSPPPLTTLLTLLTFRPPYFPLSSPFSLTTLLTLHPPPSPPSSLPTFLTRSPHPSHPPSPSPGIRLLPRLDSRAWQVDPSPWHRDRNAWPHAQRPGLEHAEPQGRGRGKGARGARASGARASGARASGADGANGANGIVCAGAGAQRR
jgi:hypothetical protein